MAGNLFRNPKRALLFVGMTLFSVAMLVGSEGNDGALVRAATNLQREDAAPHEFEGRPQQDDLSAYDEDRGRSIDHAFTSDEELIDDTQGFDPAPELEEPFDASSASMEETDTA